MTFRTVKSACDRQIIGLIQWNKMIFTNFVFNVLEHARTQNYGLVVYIICVAPIYSYSMQMTICSPLSYYDNRLLFMHGLHACN